MSADHLRTRGSRSLGDETIMPTGKPDLELLRGAWEAFAAGNLEAATAALDPELRWYAADEPDADGTCHNRGEVLAFIRRARADGVSAELLELREVGERIVSIVQTHIPSDWGDRPPPHGEVVTVRDGRVVEMVVYPTVDEALQAARASD